MMPPAQCTAGLSSPFYAECTVCGQHEDGAPQLTCLYCRSRTHTTCAQGPLASTTLFASELGADTLAAVAVGSGEPASSTTISSLSSTTAAAAAAGMGRVGPTAATQAHKAKASTEELFFCSPDCALCLNVFENPNFSPELSGFVEAALHESWRAVTEGHGAPAAVHEDDLLGAVQAAAYAQLRYDAWCHYVTLERATHALPCMLPPTHLGLAEEVVEHVTELLSAAGQAERLHLSGARIGSLLALPNDAVWRGVRPIRAGDTNNFSAEAAQQVVTTCVTPRVQFAFLFKTGHRKGPKKAPS